MRAGTVRSRCRRLGGEAEGSWYARDCQDRRSGSHHDPSPREEHDPQRELLRPDLLHHHLDVESYARGVRPASFGGSLPLRRPGGPAARSSEWVERSARLPSRPAKASARIFRFERSDGSCPKPRLSAPDRRVDQREIGRRARGAPPPQPAVPPRAEERGPRRQGGSG